MLEYSINIYLNFLVSTYILHGLGLGATLIYDLNNHCVWISEDME